MSMVLNAEALSSSLKVRLGGLNYSLTLTVPRWSNYSIARSYIGSYEIKRLLDNRNICRIFFTVDVVNNVD